MITVAGIAVLNAVFRDSGTTILGFAFPMNTDYIAIPALVVSVSTLIIVSFATAVPDESDWKEFVED